MQGWQRALADALDGEGDSAAALDAWQAEIEADEAFVDWYARTAMQASLGGQLMVRAIELEDEPADAGAVALSRARIAYRADLPSFFGMPFDEAVVFFAEKEILTPEEFDALADRFRKGGFTARALASQALRERAHRAIQRGLEEGLTLTQITEQIRADELALGMSPASHDALDTITRNAVATSYGHGKWQAYQDPDVQALRPYLEYVTAGDGRVREAHKALDGAVFEAGSDVAAYYAPPLGHRCRCGLVSRATVDADRIIRDRIPGVSPDSGWEGAPAPL